MSPLPGKFKKVKVAFHSYKSERRQERERERDQVNERRNEGSRRQVCRPKRRIMKFTEIQVRQDRDKG